MSGTKRKDLAVVVGAAGDFGRAITRRLISDGLQVLAVGRSLTALEKLAAGSDWVTPCVADIAADSAIETIAAAIDRPVRLACHGPGLAAPGSVTELAPDAIAASVNIKAGGMLRMVRAVDRALAPGSRLIGIAGHYGIEPTAYACAPGVANAALIALVRQLSLAYGQRGVTAHTIAPGPADTPRLHRIAGNRARAGETTAEAVLEELRAESSIGQFVEPEQVAWAVSILLAPEADAMTGSTMSLDAGRRRGLP